MKKKSKRGGARIGAGRKQIDDPKKQLTIFVRKSAILNNGGIEQSKRKAEQFLESLTSNNQPTK